MLRSLSFVVYPALVALLLGCPSTGPSPVDGGPDAPVDDAPQPDTPTDAPTLDVSDAGPGECLPPPDCDVALPVVMQTDWRHSTTTPLTTAMGSARHRGHDLYLRAGDEAWALAKFSYGIADDDLEDEDVEVWLLEGCEGTWERLATIATTETDGQHPDVLGVSDTEGWVFHRIPRSLPEGRHRIHFVVKGDLSTADQFIDVLGPNQRIVVSDVDGTLTESETAEFITLLTGDSPEAQPGSPEAYWAFTRRGYRMFYVSARPHWLETRTHEWLAERGYPPGIVRVTQSLTGLNGAPAFDFKTGVFEDLASRLDLVPEWAFGNKESDAEAFETAEIPERMLYQLEGELFGGTRFDDYSALISDIDVLEAVCR